MQICYLVSVTHILHFTFSLPVLPQKALREGGGGVRSGQAGPAQKDGGEGAADGAPLRYHPAERAAQSPQAGGADAAAAAPGH